MAGSWLTELTGAKKPIIGMAHLPALPGTPLYDSAGGMRHVRDWVARDLEALQGGGIDAVMFCNENDRPYRLDADVASVAAMADVVASLRGELSVPFGVNVLWDPRATLAVAAATGAAFAREIFTGAFAGDFGLWVRSAGDAFRYRREIGAESCRLLFNINAEFAAQIAPRPLRRGRPLGRLLLDAGRSLRLRPHHVATGRRLGAGGRRSGGDRLRRAGPRQHGIPRQQRGGAAPLRGRRRRRLEPEDRRRYLESGRASPRARADGCRPRGELSDRRILQESCNSRQLGCT